LRHQQENSRQPLFAGIEKLVDQIILIADVSLQQVFDKHGRQFWLHAHGVHHCLLPNMQQNAVCHCNCRGHAEGLASKPAFSKKISFAQNAKSRFFPSLRHDAALHLSILDKKQSVGRIALREYRMFLLKRQHIPTFPNGGEKDVGIETYFFLGARNLV